MRTYLVTGGAGFIGSNYIHYMFKKYDNEIRIINVDALTYAGNLENLKAVEDRDNYTFVKADICDKEAIAKIFAENDIDRVVHFAAESHVDRSIRNPEVFVQTNVLGTAVMLNCAKAAWELPDGTFKEGKKFLHVSTDEVYGSLPDDENAFFYETTPYDPHSPYSASKASSDMLVKAYMFTETEKMCVTGSSWKTMRKLLIWCRNRDVCLRHTTSAVITKSRTLRLFISFLIPCRRCFRTMIRAKRM